MSAARSDILIIGYGNPGRRDDGLGPALAEAMEQRSLPGVSVDSDYQLTVEHAEMASRYRVVVFADATTAEDGPFCWSRLMPAESAVRFTSHHLSPGDVLALTRDLFSAEPESYLLAMGGCDFGRFEAGLSPAAQRALDEATAFLVTFCSQYIAQEDLPCKTEST